MPNLIVFSADVLLKAKLSSKQLKDFFQTIVDAGNTILITIDAGTHINQAHQNTLKNILENIKTYPESEIYAINIDDMQLFNAYFFGFGGLSIPERRNLVDFETNKKISTLAKNDDANPKEIYTDTAESMSLWTNREIGNTYHESRHALQSSATTTLQTLFYKAVSSWQNFDQTIQMHVQQFDISRPVDLSDQYYVDRIHQIKTFLAVHQALEYQKGRFDYFRFSAEYTDKKQEFLFALQQSLKKKEDRLDHSKPLAKSTDQNKNIWLIDIDLEWIAVAEKEKFHTLFFDPEKTLSTAMFEQLLSELDLTLSHTSTDYTAVDQSSSSNSENCISSEAAIPTETSSSSNLVIEPSTKTEECSPSVQSSGSNSISSRSLNNSTFFATTHDGDHGRGGENTPLLGQNTLDESRCCRCIVS